jgi:hypothetical protein
MPPFVSQKQIPTPRCAGDVKKKDRKTASLHPKGAIWGGIRSQSFFRITNGWS